MKRLIYAFGFVRGWFKVQKPGQCWICNGIVLHRVEIDWTPSEKKLVCVGCDDWINERY